MASQISTDDVFKKAHDQFLASLPPNERTRLSSCSSADQLLIEVRKLEVVSKDRVRGRGFIRRIKALSDGLKPYFNSISTMIQSNPELTSLVLGGIQFVLQLASNYTTFFDKLTLNFERLAHQLPQHDLIVQLYKGSHRNEFTERVKASLEDVYVDTFQFLQSIARVFIRKDGKYKHRPLVMASLAWQPFDTRFDEMLERMELHRNVLKEVVQLDQIHAAIGERERTEKARQEEEKERLAAVKAREAQKVERALSEAIREQLLKASREAEDARLEAEERHKQDYEDRQLKDRERYEEVKERLLASDERENLKCTNERIADMKDDIEQERRVYSIDRIRNWLSPPEFLQEYEKAVDIREDGTTDWLFEDPRLENWALSNPARSAPSKFEQECLWVQGNPGYGKTVLAAAAVGELKCIIGNETNDISDTHPGVFHFLFRAGIPTMDSNDAAHRAILAQILQAHRQDLDAIDKFVFAMNEMSGGQMVASKNELAELLRVFSTYIGRYYIVLDGIDECRDNSALVQDLLKLKQDSQIMILLFSRPNVASLFQTIPTEQHIFVGRKTSRDIEVYLSKQVNLLQEQNLLPSTANTGKLVSHLVTGADGMFLWARLMVSFLKSPALSRAQRVEAIKRVTLPEGLESMYDRISDLIGQGYQAEQHFAKQIIIWLTFTIRRLTVQELQEATASTNMEESEPEDIQEFIQRVVMTCAGLVEPEEMYSPAHGRTSSFFRFIHLSAKEYYASQENFTISSNKKSFSITPWNCHIEITRRCLYFLTYKLPAQPLQGSLGSSVTHDALDKVFPFSSYAALYWIEHLQESNFDIVRVAKNNDFTTQDQFGDLLLALSRFLSQSFVLMSWIEASYVCGQAPSFELLQQWSNWAKNIRELHLPQDLDVNKLHEDVMELSCYLKELNEYWGSKLITTPGCIWEEVTAFTPCRLLPRIGVLTVHSLVTEELSGDYLSTKCLCKVSESTPNGLLVGVLSIWPSRDYEKFTQQKSKDVSLKTLRNLSLGWVARYEIWSLAAEPARIVDHRFSLDSKEVWLQMGHSMCNSVEPGEARGWGIQFPMAISASVRMFTVLRTLYCLKPATSKPGLILDSSILAMEVDGSIPTHWSPDHNPFVRAGDSFESSYLELDERFERGDLYLYWISFHPDDRFILFVGQDLHAPSTAAVFHIQSSKKLAAPCFNCSKLNAEGSLRRHPEWSRDFNQVKVIYHPTNPLLGFSFAGLLYLWPFKNTTERPSPLCSIDPNSEVQFSSCGNHVIFSEPLEGRLMKKPIPARFYQVQHVVVRSNHLLANSGGALLIKRTDWRSPSPSERRRMSQNSRPQSRSNERRAFISTVRSSDNNINLELWQDRRSLQDSKELTKLPSWADDGMAKISVKIPEDRDEAIKIILNKAAKPWYGMSDPVDRHLPALVERDQRSVDLPKGLIEDRPTSAIAVDGSKISSLNIVRDTTDFGDRPRTLAAEFLESWWNSTADSPDDLAFDSFLPRAAAIDRFASWLVTTDDSPHDPTHKIFGLMLAAGEKSADVRVKNATDAIVEFRKAFMASMAARNTGL